MHTAQYSMIGGVSDNMRVSAYSTGGLGVLVWEGVYIQRVGEYRVSIKYVCILYIKGRV